MKPFSSNYVVGMLSIASAMLFLVNFIGFSLWMNGGTIEEKLGEFVNKKQNVKGIKRAKDCTNKALFFASLCLL